MEVITGPPTWGDSEETGPDSPSSVLEALALHPSCSSKVRKMSKEFDRLRQYKASAGDPPRGTKSQGDPGTPLAIDDEAYSVGSDQTGTFVAILRERRQSLQPLEERRARESSTVSDAAKRECTCLYRE